LDEQRVFAFLERRRRNLSLKHYGSSTVVEHSPNHPEVRGVSAFATNGIERENGKKSKTFSVILL
jgi:hypothetical protein